MGLGRNKNIKIIFLLVTRKNMFDIFFLNSWIFIFANKISLKCIIYVKSFSLSLSLRILFHLRINVSPVRIKSNWSELPRPTYLRITNIKFDVPLARFESSREAFNQDNRLIRMTFVLENEEKETNIDMENVYQDSAHFSICSIMENNDNDFVHLGDFTYA